MIDRVSFVRRSFLATVVALFAIVSTSAQQLRIVSYNTANDVGTAGADTHTPTIGGAATSVFTAMGSMQIGGISRPVDIIAFQESVYSTSSPNPTAAAFASVLNNIYGAGTYSVASLVGTTTGPNAGNGPNTLVYRNTTVSLVSQQALGTPSGRDVARQVMKYQFQPIGFGTNAQFYLYNSHMKSGTTSGDDDRRGAEATVIKNSVNSLPANTPVIFAGDYNPTNNTNDQGYQGVVSGPTSNKAIDPLNPTNVFQNWDTAALKSMATFSAATTSAFSGQGLGGMRYRDDFLMNSSGMLSGNGIQYSNGSFTAFGNTGTHTYQQAVTTGSSSAFAAQLTGYNATQAATVLNDLAILSDHLPVIAQYNLTPVPEPGCVVAIGLAVLFFGKRTILKFRANAD